MVRFKFLLVISALAVALSLAPSAPSHADPNDCTFAQKKAGVCPTSPQTGGKANGGSVDLSAESDQSSGGESDHAAKSGGSSAGSQARPTMCVSHKSTTGASPWGLCDTGGLSDMVHRHPQLVPTIADPTAACTLCSAETIVRVTDLKNFPAPIAPTGMEPNGWAIVGLAANFWTGASAQIGEGLLLGEPAQVMFTPIAFRWSFGDGATSTSTNGGASWAALGIAEFSETATSHVYTARGTYSVVLTVDYLAHYSFGDQGWRPVEGIVTVPSLPFAIMAANESTVLIAGDCLTNPRGPGC